MRLLLANQFDFFSSQLSSYLSVTSTKFVIFQFRWVIFFSSLYFFGSVSITRMCICVFFRLFLHRFIQRWYRLFFRLPLSNIHSNIYNLKFQAYKRLLFICPFPMIRPYLLLLVLFFLNLFFAFTLLLFLVYISLFSQLFFVPRYIRECVYTDRYTHFIRLFDIHHKIHKNPHIDRYYLCIFEIVQCARTNRNKLFTLD